MQLLPKRSIVAYISVQELSHFTVGGDANRSTKIEAYISVQELNHVTIGGDSNASSLRMPTAAGALLD